jgi:ParB-like chromosome segregation protein Spo0J
MTRPAAEPAGDSGDPAVAEEPADGQARTHPMAQLLPMLRQDYEQLKEDIRRHGIKVPILVTPDGLVVDGSHRERACRELGIECPSVTLDDTRPESLVAVVTSMNIYRRHLRPEQIAAWFERVQRECPTAAATVLDVEQVKEAAAAAKKGNLKRGPSRRSHVTTSGRTVAAKAAALKVSPSTIQRVDRVAREAPDQLERIERGEISSAKALKKPPAKPKASRSGPSRAEDSGRFRGMLPILAEGAWVAVD